jgi:hypothetical protein
MSASIAKNGYTYAFYFNFTADGSPKRVSFGLYPLLKIETFESMLDESGCHLIFAKVSDPRKNRPITVRIVRITSGTESELPMSSGENGTYSSKLCAGTGAVVKAYASNAYEAAEKMLVLEQAAPLPPPIEPEKPQVNDTPAPPKEEFQLKKVSSDWEPEVVLAGVGMIFVLVAIIALIVGRKDPRMSKYFVESWGVLLGSILRPIIVYLRSLKKKEPPRQQG